MKTNYGSYIRVRNDIGSGPQNLPADVHLTIGYKDESETVLLSPEMARKVAGKLFKQAAKVEEANKR